MAIQVTIIGLGQIGASLGLALGEKKELFLRVGHDRDLGIAHKAQKLGAIDQVAINLPRSVENADIVVLALPMDQVRETLSVIAPVLKAGAVVMDTAPLKEVVASWVGELLPPERYYVGLTPVINPNYLHTIESGLEAAHADLFHDGMFAIVSTSRSHSDAIELAAELARLLGATPIFADAVELDSLMAATYLLPQVIAAALLNTTVDQPGWREGRKFAGGAYAGVTSAILRSGSSAALRASALLNRENMLRVLDGLISVLQMIREDIDRLDATSLEARFDQARAGRELWWRQRQAANWIAEEVDPSTLEMPKSSDIFTRMIGFGRKKKPGR